MRTIGITGGIGSGKSTVLAAIADCFREKDGACRVWMVEMDALAKQMQQKGEELFFSIVQAFGSGIVGEDGELDRDALAELVFRDDAKLKLLNHLVHPAVKRQVLALQRQAEEKGCALFVMESALLLEEHYDAFCDSVWFVQTDRQTRIRRLIRDRGYSEEKAESIIRSQKSDREFLAVCDTVILNSGTKEETAAHVRRELDALRKQDCGENNENGTL